MTQLFFHYLQDGTQSLVRNNIRLLHLTHFVEHIVGEIGALVLNGNGTVRIVILANSAVGILQSPHPQKERGSLSECEKADISN